MTEMTPTERATWERFENTHEVPWAWTNRRQPWHVHEPEHARQYETLGDPFKVGS